MDGVSGVRIDCFKAVGRRDILQQSTQWLDKPRNPNDTNHKWGKIKKR
jgi:hypothetical protein